MGKNTLLGSVLVLAVAVGAFRFVSLTGEDVLADIERTLGSDAFSAQVIGSSVDSFSVYPSSVSSALTFLISWSLSGSSGATVYFDCPLGVSIKDESGSSVGCASAVSMGGVSSGTRSYSVYNVSGMVQTMAIRMIPKDVSGAENTNGLKRVVLTVLPTAQPILSLSASTLTPESGGAVTLSWVGQYVEGVNLQFGCVKDLEYYADDDKTIVPCGTPAFSSNIPTSGSYTFYVYNRSLTSSYPFNVQVLPSQGGAYYDATKSLMVTLTAQKDLPEAQPSIVSFSSSKNSVYSTESFKLSWNIKDAEGANLQFSCDSRLAVYAGTSTAPMRCGVAGFSDALPAQGEITVSVENLGVSPRIGTFILLPQRSDGTYTTYGARSVSVSVAVETQPSTTVPPPATTPVALELSTDGVLYNQFTISMEIGSKGEQITALQKFLAMDSSIYPEAIVSGYFGSLTELAVKRFQKKHGIASPGDTGYGYVGPKTRAKLNTLERP